MQNNDKLSEHFCYAELTTTSFRQYDNTPSSEVLANLTLLANETLEPVRALLGPMHVNSGYRSIEVNTAVGGQPTSQHCQGLACDFVPIDGTFKGAVKKILDSNIEFDQIIAENWKVGGGWIHISHAPSTRPPRRSVIAIGSWTNHKYVNYDPTTAPDL